MASIKYRVGNLYRAVAHYREISNRQRTYQQNGKIEIKQTDYKALEALLHLYSPDKPIKFRELVCAVDVPSVIVHVPMSVKYLISLGAITHCDLEAFEFKIDPVRVHNLMLMYEN
jgi:hypothetical protein